MESGSLGKTGFKWKSIFDTLGHDAESFNHPKHSEIIIRAKNWITDREKDY